MKASLSCFSHFKVECEAEDSVLVSHSSRGAGAAVVHVGGVSFIILVAMSSPHYPEFIYCDVSTGLEHGNKKKKS